MRLLLAAAFAMGRPRGAVFEPQPAPPPTPLRVPYREPGELIAAISRRVQPMLDASARLFNTSFSLGFRKGEARGAFVAGLEDFATGAAMSPDDLIPLGSVTKPFTAARIFQLVDAGAFALDDPIAPLVDPALTAWNGTTMARIFAGQEARVARMTVRHVLGMRSGFDRPAAIVLRCGPSPPPPPPQDPGL